MTKYNEQINSESIIKNLNYTSSAVSVYKHSIYNKATMSYVTKVMASLLVTKLEI